MNIDNILCMPLETLLVVFFNTISSDNGFEVQSNYRKTKFSRIDCDSYELTAKSLSNKYGIYFEVKNKSSIVLFIKNNKNLSLDEFLNLVYENIIIRIPRLNSTYRLDTEIALALFILRGSADFKGQFYSVDLKNPTRLYINNFFKILLSSDTLLSKLNFNFRELQPQYISGKNKRNSQIRVNLKWFFNNVILNYNNINEYKTNILLENQSKIGEERNLSSFEERLIFYTRNILGKELKKEEVEKFRQELEFENNIIEKSTFGKRNQKIVAFAREILDDECVGCRNNYKIEDRSFKMYKTGRYYLEINHVISYASDSKNVDVLDNLVKLCPVCHRILTPNRADPKLQKSIIKNMMNSRQEVNDFIIKMTPPNIDPIEFVFNNLK